MGQLVRVSNVCYGLLVLVGVLHVCHCPPVWGRLSMGLCGVQCMLGQLLEDWCDEEMEGGMQGCCGTFL